jgi:hypothetical protein
VKVKQEVGQAADRPHRCQDYRLPTEQAHGRSLLIGIRLLLTDVPSQDRNEVRDTADGDNDGSQNNDDRHDDQALRCEICLRAPGELTVQRYDDRGGIGSTDQVAASEAGSIVNRYPAAGRPLRWSGFGHGNKVAERRNGARSKLNSCFSISPRDIPVT